jgi:hypothetical protein
MPRTFIAARMVRMRRGPNQRMSRPTTRVRRSGRYCAGVATPAFFISCTHKAACCSAALASSKNNIWRGVPDSASETMRYK